MEGDTEAAPQAPTGWWCKTCDEPVRLTGGGLIRRAVHLATGLEAGPADSEGPDGKHIAVPTDQSPEIRAEAAKVSEEFGKWYLVATGFGQVRAWMRPELLPVGAIPGTYYGRDAGELRPQLRAVLTLPGSEQVPLPREMPSEPAKRAP
jgi:hypothetical protein